MADKGSASGAPKKTIKTPFVDAVQDKVGGKKK